MCREYLSATDAVTYSVYSQHYPGMYKFQPFDTEEEARARLAVLVLEEGVAPMSEVGRRGDLRVGVAAVIVRKTGNAPSNFVHEVLVRIGGGRAWYE